MDTRVPTAFTFIDFKKAFDCVQHPVLINKLRKLGLSEFVIDWVTGYLSHTQ